MSFFTVGSCTIDRLNSRRGERPNLRLEIAAVPAWSAPKKCSGTNISQDIETGNITLSFSRYIVLLGKNVLTTTKK